MEQNTVTYSVFILPEFMAFTESGNKNFKELRHKNLFFRLPRYELTDS